VQVIITHPRSANRSADRRHGPWKRSGSAHNGARRQPSALRLRPIRLSDAARQLAKVVQAERRGGRANSTRPVVIEGAREIRLLLDEIEKRPKVIDVAPVEVTT
jgi:hypothetical protein